MKCAFTARGSKVWEVLIGYLRGDWSGLLIFCDVAINLHSEVLGGLERYFSVPCCVAYMESLALNCESFSLSF